MRQSTLHGRDAMKLFVVAAVLALNIGASRAAEPLAPPTARDEQHFAVEYAAVFGDDVPAGAMTLWMPVPSDSAAQSLDSIAVEAQLAGGKLVKWEIKRESEYGNRFLQAQVEGARPADKVLLRYNVTRRELANVPSGMAPVRTLSAPEARLLQADRLVPLDGPVAQLARETITPAQSPDEKIRALYDKTVGLMRYDKSGTGWGQGDVIWACDNKRGNCTDFHSVLIGMARVSGIPASFEIGLQIPTDKSAGKLTGYHCWAYVWSPQRGWVPLDASEGWKSDRKYKDYYLGRLGSDRIALSMGRDLKLGQKGKPLNYFVFPYAEAGEGASVPMKVDVSFRTIAPAL